MICEKCHEPIDKKKGDYFKVMTYLKGKRVKTRHIHKKCHERTNKVQKDMQKNIQKTMKGLTSIFPGKKVVEIVNEKEES